jgi:hypothetical protein
VEVAVDDPRHHHPAAEIDQLGLVVVAGDAEFFHAGLG